VKKLLSIPNRYQDKEEQEVEVVVVVVVSIRRVKPNKTTIRGK
jgi:hypothetical protein